MNHVVYMESGHASEIRALRNLERGWNYGKGGPISNDVIDIALSMDRYANMLGFEAADVVPGTHGSIGLYYYYGINTVQISIAGAKRISVYWDVCDETVDEAEDVDENLAKRWFWEKRQKIWNLSVTSTPGIGSRIEDDSAAKRSNPVRTEASPSRRPYALWKPLVTSAAMAESYTPKISLTAR